jgi:hypothetical protein
MTADSAGSFSPPASERPPNQAALAPSAPDDDLQVSRDPFAIEHDFAES